MSSNKDGANQTSQPVTSLEDDIQSLSTAVGAHFPNTRRRIEETSPERDRGDANAGDDGDGDDEEELAVDEAVGVATLLSGETSGGNAPAGDADVRQTSNTNPATDESASPTLPQDAVLPGRYFRQIRTRRGEVAAKVSQRMAEATRRREELLNERKQHLLEVERRRLQKVHQVKNLRLAALGALIRNGLEPLNHLQRAGLHVSVNVAEQPPGAEGASSVDASLVVDALEQQLSPDAIEMILVSDRRACDLCEQDTPVEVALANKARAVCPHTNKPHRRSLVVAAEAFLRLVGDTRVNLVGGRLEQVGSSTPAAPRQRAKRGIAVNPQLFVLSYYTAVLPEGEVDALLKEYAACVVYATEQLRSALEQAQHSIPAGATGVSPSSPGGADLVAKANEAYLKPLLQSFARAWRRYAILSDQQLLQNMTVEGRESATQELLQATDVTLESTYRKLADTSVAMQAIQEEQLQRRQLESTGTAPAQTHDERTEYEGATQLRINRLTQELAALSAFISMLRTRMYRIGGLAALEAFDQRMRENDATRQQASATNHNQGQLTDDISDFTPERHRGGGGVVVGDPTTETRRYNGGGGGSAVASPVVASPLINVPVPPNTPAIGSNEGATSGASAFDRANHQQGARTIPRHYDAGPQEYVGTSGSDSELGNSVSPSGPARRYGPELPPLWSVDASGKSHPPSAETLRQEENGKLEYRARSAYTAKMKRDAMKTKSEEEWRAAAEQLAQQFDEALWEQVASELDAQPPVVARLPGLLSAVAESLIDALPRRIRAKIGQEIRDVLDWGLLRRQLATATTQVRVNSIISLMIYVVNRVGQLGAPAKEEDLKTTAKALAEQASNAAASDQTSSSSPTSVSVGKAVVAIFRFMFQSIQDLRKDIAEYSLKLISHELVENAAKYEIAFVNAVLPPPESWNETRDFLHSSITSSKTVASLAVPPNLVDAVLRSTGNGAVVATVPTTTSTSHVAGTPLNVTVLDALPPSTLYITDADKEIFAGLAFGLVDLVRTGGKLTADRWSNYPKESFYFARPLIFECANTVQLLTLRLMIGGTVSMILNPVRIQPAALQQFLQELDGKVQQWLHSIANTQPNKTTLEGNDVHQQVRTIEDLKGGVVEEVLHFLASGPPQQAVYTSITSAAAQAGATQQQLPPLELSERDEVVLRGVLGKLTDTTGAQYVTFESRVLKAITGVVLETVGSQTSGINAETSTAGVRFNPRLKAASAIAQRAVGNLIIDAVKETGALLAAVLLHNFAVYRQYYPRVLSGVAAVSDNNDAPVPVAETAA